MSLNQQDAKPSLDHLAGLLDRVTLHNADSGFCVRRLKVKGELELITLVAHAPVVSGNAYASASGYWVIDREHRRTAIEPPAIHNT